MDRILLATDLTARSDRAFDRAVRLAQAHCAALRVIHAVDTSLLLARFVKQELREAKAHLESEIREATDRVPKVVAKVSGGDPDTVIIEDAKAERADLIILGSPDYGRLSAAFRGTTADRVIRAAPCPVLTVKTRPRRDYASVVVALDKGAPSRRALEFALQLCPRAQFSAVHIDETSGGASRSPRGTRQKQDVRRSLNEILQAAQSARPASGNSAGPKLVIRRGAARNLLQEAIEALEPDLVVIGTHARTGVSKLFLGSMAEALLGSLRCDALVARA